MTLLLSNLVQIEDIWLASMSFYVPSTVVMMSRLLEMVPMYALFGIAVRQHWDLRAFADFFLVVQVQQGHNGVYQHYTKEAERNHRCIKLIIYTCIFEHLTIHCNRNRGQPAQSAPRSVSTPSTYEREPQRRKRATASQVLFLLRKWKIGNHSCSLRLVLHHFICVVLVLWQSGLNATFFFSFFFGALYRLRSADCGAR